MSSTHTRAPRGGFLALLASFAMIAMGLLGVVAAAPASAVGNVDADSNNPARVCAAAGFTGGWARISANGSITSGGAGGYSVSATGLPGKSGDWTSSPAAAAVFLHAGDKTLNKYMGSGTSGSWSDPKHGISTLTFCYGPTYSASKTSGGTATYCLAGTEGSYAYFGSGTATSSLSQADADEKAQEAADAAAAADKTAKLPSGATDGACTVFTATKSATGSATYCLADQEDSYDYSGTGTASSTLSQEDADAKAQALADANAQADKTAKLPTGATPGACDTPEPFTSTRTAGGTVDYCLAGSEGSYAYFGSGTATSTESQAKADELAQKAADDAAAADRLAKLPSGATEGECTVYTATKSAGGSVGYCLNGSEGSFDYSGEATATSTLSQDDADVKAQTAADAAASADRVAKLPQGATVGTCTPDFPETPETPETPQTPETPATTTVVEPAVVEAPAVETPAVVAVPAAATVAEAPATVAVPAAATLPASVPAGGGSTAPGVPAWALALLVAGALGTVAGARVMRGSK